MVMTEVVLNIKKKLFHYISELKGCVITLITLFLVLMFIIIFTFRLISDVKEFRSLPKKSFLDKYISGSWPHEIFARFLIFKPGTPAYQNTIRSWVYHSDQLSDNIWNRWILEKDVDRMSFKEKLTYLPHYPLRPDNILPHLMDILFLAEEGHVILPVLIKAKKGEDIFRIWYSEKLIKPQNTDLFIKSVGSIIIIPDVSIDRFLEIFWDKIVEKDKVHFVLQKIAANLKLNTKVSITFLSWLEKIQSRKILKMDYLIAKLLGKYQSSSSFRERRKALDIFKREWENLEPAYAKEFIVNVSDEKKLSITKEIFYNKEFYNPQSSLEFFHVITHFNLREAEKIAMPILAAPDSEIRKGMIVLLIRHKSHLGKNYIDETFINSAPRKTLFTSPNQYIYGSKAVERYCIIAGHEYLETGKTWPPSSVRNRDIYYEPNRWEEFIKLYPWFPGTDDAFYRMAYFQYLVGDLKNAVKTIQTVNSSELPDNDAIFYIAHLLRNISFSNKYNKRDRMLRFLRHIKNIQEIHKLMYFRQPKRYCRDILDSIRWFKRHSDYRRLLEINDETLNTMKQILDKISRYSISDRFQVIMKGIGSRREAEDILSTTFYGISGLPRYIEGMEITDICYKNIRNAAGNLKRKISGTRSNRDKRNYIFWALLHYYAMPHPANNEFKFALNYGEKIPPSYYPSNLRWMRDMMMKLLNKGGS